jgi:hypothetical protein
MVLDGLDDKPRGLLFQQVQAASAPAISDCSSAFRSKSNGGFQQAEQPSWAATSAGISTGGGREMMRP